MHPFPLHLDLTATQTQSCAYLGIIKDILGSLIDSWQLMQKQACYAKSNKNLNDENMDMAKGSRLLMDQPSERYQPSLDTITDLHSYANASTVDVLPEGSSSTIVTDHIHDMLPLNELQQLVVEEVLEHIICTSGQLCTKKDQMLLYVKSEGGVDKNRIIKALQIRVTLLNKQEELVITVPTRCAAESIGGNTVHTALNINT